MASGSDVKVTVTIEPEDARKLAAEVFELRERLKEAEDRAASWEALDAEAQIGADEVSRQLRDLKAELADVRARADAADAEIGRLVAELAVVRRDWQADVGTLTARAQTAEADARRWRAEAHRMMDLMMGEHMRSLKQSAAARKVAQAYRELDAENSRWIGIVSGVLHERDAARAEAARYAEALANSDPWTNDVPFNCVYCDAVWGSDIGSSENQHNAGCVWIAAAERVLLDAAGR